MKQHKCPICSTEVLQRSSMPFCGDSCRDIDFLAWSKQSYSITGSDVGQGMLQDTDEDYFD